MNENKRNKVMMRLKFNATYDPICKVLLEVSETNKKQFDKLLDYVESLPNKGLDPENVRRFSYGRKGQDKFIVDKLTIHCVKFFPRECKNIINEMMEGEVINV